MKDAADIFRFYGEGEKMPSRSTFRRRLAADRFPDGDIHCENENCPMQKATTWAGRPMVFDLDHKRAVSRDNRRQNLWFLCPNCHRVLSPYGGGNAGMVEYTRGGFARVRQRGKPERDYHLPLEAIPLPNLDSLTPEEVAQLTGPSPHDRPEEP